MAIDRHTARFLVASRASGVRFDRTATLGRQNLYLNTREFRDLLLEYQVQPDADEQALTRGGAFADGLFETLGTKELTSIDASSFEGATWIHDMNNPIPSDWRERFDLVFDGGTLEHVFQFPTALKSAMEMVKVGGHLLIQTPANNFCGHGFYQFSPELYFRVLSESNGFEIRRMLAVESFPGGRWYEIRDPAAFGFRVELAASDHRVLLLLSATRTKQVPILQTPPQQSDYVVSWDQNVPHEVRYWQGNGPGGRKEEQTNRRIANLLARAAMSLAARCGRGGSRWIRSWYDALQTRKFSLQRQPHIYRPVDK